MDRAADDRLADTRLPFLPRKTSWVEPISYNDRENFKGAMFEALANNCSDIFIQSGHPLVVKKSGVLYRMTESALDAQDAMTVLGWVGGDAAQGMISQGEEVVSSYSLPDPVEVDETGEVLRHRFRVNGVRIRFKGGYGVQCVIRTIPSNVPKAVREEDLTDYTYKPGYVSLPGAMIDAFLNIGHGAAYMCGSTGQGKSTTLAAIFRHGFETHDSPLRGPFMSLEAPVEFMFDRIRSPHSIIAQSEVGPGQDIASFARGVRGGMRRAPTSIYVGEVRDFETASGIVEAANTGHSCFATVHANDSPEVFSRILELYPLASREAAISSLISTTRIIANQILVPCALGGQTALRSMLVLGDDLREELLTVSDLSKLERTVRAMLNECGVSRTASAQIALERGLIDKRTFEQFKPRISRG